MSSFIKHTILENDFLLHSSRVVYWEQESILILSDMHFGKITHFRKNGIAVPTDIMKEDIQRLFDVIQFFKPKKVIIVGDLFHSIANNEHELFKRWRNDFLHIEFILVKGNHDIIVEDWYIKANITLVATCLQIQNFFFVHQQEDFKNVVEENHFLFCGHVHPAIVLKGMGRQSLKLPCYYFSNNKLLLPAFGKFTGNFIVEPKKQDTVYAIVNKDVIKL